METRSAEKKCPMSACDGSLVAGAHGTVRCSVCGADFVNSIAAELVRSRERLTAIEARRRLIRKRLRP